MYSPYHDLDDQEDVELKETKRKFWGKITHSIFATILLLITLYYYYKNVVGETKTADFYWNLLFPMSLIFYIGCAFCAFYYEKRV